jgi:hypothetical protein
MARSMEGPPHPGAVPLHQIVLASPAFTPPPNRESLASKGNAYIIVRHTRFERSPCPIGIRVTQAEPVHEAAQRIFKPATAEQPSSLGDHQPQYQFHRYLKVAVEMSGRLSNVNCSPLATAGIVLALGTNKCATPSTGPVPICALVLAPFAVLVQVT